MDDSSPEPGASTPDPARPLAGGPPGAAEASDASPRAERGSSGCRFSIIVPVLNERRLLPECLPTVIRAVRAYGDAEAIVVDNGSSDGTYELLRDRFSDSVRVSRLPGATIGAARNHGAALATGDVLSFLDADFTIPPDFLTRAARILDDPEVAATGAHYVLPGDASRVERAWFSMHIRRSGGFVHYIPSGDFIVRRAAFDTIGGFSEDLRTGEDAEFCQRLRARGFRIFESSTLAGVHHGNAKTLGAFFRKEVWRGLGMFGTVGGGEIDKPTTMLFAFLALVLAGTAIGVAAVDRGHPVGGALGFLGCTLLVPVITAAYRWRICRRISYPFLSVLLYLLYYAARGRALLLIGIGAVRKRSTRPGGSIGTGEEA